MFIGQSMDNGQWIMVNVQRTISAIGTTILVTVHLELKRNNIAGHEFTSKVFFTNRINLYNCRS